MGGGLGNQRSSRHRRLSAWAAALGCRSRVKAPFLSTDAHDAGRGGEVGEVPHLLADNGVDAVEDPMIHVQVFDLVLLGPRVSRHDRVQAWVGVGAVLGDDDRLSSPAQAVSSSSQASSAASRSPVLTYQP